MTKPNSDNSITEEEIIDRLNQRIKEEGRYPDKPQGLDVSLGNSSAVMFHGILGTFNQGGEFPFPPSQDQESIEE
ncbi:MAG: hypothetical protein HOD72_09965 [Opitutae bacterium]|nr:hypothetical protein [Opitutae bacterium]MBT5380622.1 hypothetical protein [Opitutae bacterium]MBT5689493.1 hypothetical protein [Opitutae bacterium]